MNCTRRPVFQLPSLGLHKRDRDGVQELERARLNGRTVALGILVVAGSASKNTARVQPSNRGVGNGIILR